MEELKMHESALLVQLKLRRLPTNVGCKDFLLQALLANSQKFLERLQACLTKNLDKYDNRLYKSQGCCNNGKP